MSLDVAAGLAGRSKSWLSKVERGLLPLERRSDLAALADALDISPIDLTGYQHPALHLRRLGPYGLFERYAGQVDYVWQRSRPLPAERGAMRS
jgi:transcriptional regulator with XRE-family HTH domain